MTSRSVWLNPPQQSRLGPVSYGLRQGSRKAQGWKGPARNQKLSGEFLDRASLNGVMARAGQNDRR